MRKRRSIIWKIPRDRLIEIISVSDTISDVLKHFGLLNKGGNFRTFINRVNYDNIDISELRKRANKKRTEKIGKPRPLNEILINRIM